MPKSKKKHKYIKPIIEGCDRPNRIKPAPEDESWLSKNGLNAAYAWRIIQSTIEELESKPTRSQYDEPMNSEFKEWVDFKQTISSNDEIWIYNSPKNFWKIGMGSCGLLLVRDSIPISMVVCKFN